VGIPFVAERIDDSLHMPWSVSSCVCSSLQDSSKPKTPDTYTDTKDKSPEYKPEGQPEEVKHKPEGQGKDDYTYGDHKDTVEYTAP
jgi:hypothetical protein